MRWDSLGEFCALVASFEHFGEVFKNDKAKLLAETLDQAIGQHLEDRRAVRLIEHLGYKVSLEAA